MGRKKNEWLAKSKEMCVDNGISSTGSCNTVINRLLALKFPELRAKGTKKPHIKKCTTAGKIENKSKDAKTVKTPESKKRVSNMGNKYSSNDNLFNQNFAWQAITCDTISNKKLSAKQYLKHHNDSIQDAVPVWVTYKTFCKLAVPNVCKDGRVCWEEPNK